MKKSRRGILLVTVLVLSGILIAFAAAVCLVAVGRSKAGSVDLESGQATTLADGGTEVAAKAVLDALADYGTVPTSGSTTTEDGQAVTYEIEPVGSSRTSTSSGGLYTLYQQYQITSTAYSEGVPSVVCTIIDAGRTPIFQFLNFYNDDLEIFPGANMTLNGRIHTNKDLYIGTDASLTLNSTYIGAAGEMHRERKDTTQAETHGTTTVNGAHSAVWASDKDSQMAGWGAYAAATWGGTVQSSESGVTPIATPTVPSVASDGYFHDNAGLVILDGAAYQGGVNVTGSLPAGTLSSVTVYDAREGRNITTTQIDIAKLNGSGKFPANGLLWAGRSDTTPGQPNGIQLVNGSTLSAGLTVVTPDPVYIKGDFNSVAKKPAAVVADALNLLSNGWNNTKTASSTLPTASNTTYNAAFIAGNVPHEAGGAYSGGFENFPRFHENWSGKTCTIRGSFVELWESQYAQRNWPGTGGHYYNPPTRNWDYDSAFNNPASLPPFTPWTARVGRVVWWQKQ